MNSSELEVTSWHGIEEEIEKGSLFPQKDTDWPCRQFPVEKTLFGGNLPTFYRQRGNDGTGVESDRYGTRGIGHINMFNTDRSHSVFLQQNPKRVFPTIAT